MTTAPPLEREFQFDQNHFDLLRSIAKAEAGIELNDTKRELVYGRVARRLRELKLTSFDEYCELVRPQNAPERADFINCITTNFTSFFREGHHFDFLREEGLPKLMSRRAGNRRLRIWSAACSTGQEPYTIAMTVRETPSVDDSWDCRILATDIDSNVLAKAQSGVYKPMEIGDLGGEKGRRRWFKPVPGDPDGAERIDRSLQEMIYFRSLNLMESWPMSGPIDVIFCRNVVIYFSKETQRQIFDRFAKLMAPDGYLFIGHSETILHAADVFEPVGRTIYRLRGNRA